MIPLPTQLTALYFLLALAVAVFSFLLAIIVKKSNTLDKMQEDFSQKELQLNQKLYETSVIKGKLEVLVNSMTEGVFMLDKDLNLLVVNPACRKILEIGPSEDLTIFDIVRAFDGYFAIEEELAKVFDSKEISKISEVKFKNKFVQITIIPAEVAKGVPGAGVLIHNRTEEHKLEEKHEEFMAMIVHELRSPLTVIKNMTEMLEKDFSRLDEDTRDEMLEQMKDNSTKLLTIVNALLDDTKADLTDVDLNKDKADIKQLLEDKIENYMSLANEKGVKLNLKVDEDIPSFDFDYDKIGQVLNNLLSNALKFTEEGSVDVVARSFDNEIRVSVADSGIGISNEDKPKLFHKFVQLNNHTDDSKPSTGLGLAISKNIVNSHKGEIWVEDNKPKGAKFIFTLPV